MVNESFPRTKVYFLYAENKDSAFLEIEFKNNQFEGRLVNNFHETDGSFGYYSGKLTGDTPKGTYPMVGEGMILEHEIINSLDITTLQEVSGPDRGGGSALRMVFVHYDSVQFTAKKFHKTDCQSPSIQNNMLITGITEISIKIIGFNFIFD